MNTVNYKGWALRFIVWILITNLVVFFLGVSYVDLPGVSWQPGLTLFCLGILSHILVILSLTFIIVSRMKREERDYQYWISIVGIFLFGVLPLILSLA